MQMRAAAVRINSIDKHHAVIQINRIPIFPLHEPSHLTSPDTANAFSRALRRRRTAQQQRMARTKQMFIDESSSVDARDSNENYIIIFDRNIQILLAAIDPTSATDKCHIRILFVLRSNNKSVSVG